MTVTVRYIGTVNPYFELAVTGKPTKWTPGRSGDVSDGDAALLIATGVFEVYADKVLPFVFSSSGAIVGARKTDGSVAAIGSGVDASMTAAQLETARAAGTLTALSIYAAKDTGALYYAPAVDVLDPLGGTVYAQESATAFAIATASLTAIGTGGQFDVRGYKTLALSYKNAGSTSLSGFEIAIKQGSGAWNVTHSTASDFLNAGDDLVIDITTDDTDLDLTTLTNAKTANIRLDVRGIDYVRIRAQQASSDGTCDWYATKEG